MQSLSRETLRMRFMGAVAYVARSTVAFMCTGDQRDRLSLLAIVEKDQDRRVVGMGTYVSLASVCTGKPRSLPSFSGPT
jgi:hypothetical protein